VQLEAAQAIDQRLSEASRRVDDAYYELEDVGQALGSYADQLQYDPSRLEEIEERLSALQKLKRKYGASLHEVLAYRADAQARLARLENWAEDRAALEAEAAALEGSVYKQAESLSAARALGAAELEKSVAAILKTLGMPNARFSVMLERKPLADGKVVVGPYGADEPEFFVSANKGEPQRPLAQVASGGELSRIMLALKTVLAKADGVPTMIFDEIDTGIGGEVALGVGEHLAVLSETKQVFCITHLASIAVRADNHYKVEKQIEGERTVTKVSRLEGTARVREIARMLSGDAEGAASLAHAEQLLNKFGRIRG
jgi:DNA repair protein RecN (Recombination protein N)